MKGLELLNAATAELTVDPPLAKPEPDVQPALGWDEIHRSIFKAMAEDGHPPILEEHDGKPMVKLHTCWLGGDHQQNHRAGRYSTASEGKDLSKPNAFGFPLPNGGIAIYRFGDAGETADWHRTANGRMCIHYNVTAPEVAKPRLLTCKQLDSLCFKLRFLIDGVWVAEHPGFFAGGMKDLETTLAVNAGISLATATPFLERFPVPQPCRVLLASAESGMATLQETARRICEAKELCLADIDNLFWTDWLPTLTSARHLDRLERTIEETACEVLFLDPVYLMMPGADASNLMTQGERLRPLSEICQRHRVSPILLHHTRKRGKGDRNFDPPELSDLAWAGFGEYARQWILLGRREPYEPGTGLHRLWMSAGGSPGHGGMWAIDVEEGPSGQPRHWKVSLSTPSEAREEKRGGTVRQRILDAANRRGVGGELPDSLLRPRGRGAKPCRASRQLPWPVSVPANNNAKGFRSTSKRMPTPLCRAHGWHHRQAVQDRGDGHEAG